MTQLIRYEAACKALAEAVAVDEVMDVADKAAAMQSYGRIAKNKDLETQAAEIRIRAERRLGELLLEQKNTTGLAPPGRPKTRHDVVKKSVVGDDRLNSDQKPEQNAKKSVPTLAEAGISKDLSSRSQRLAAVPQAEFEEAIDEWKGKVKGENERVVAKLELAGERALSGSKKPKYDIAAMTDADIESVLEENEKLKKEIEKLNDRLEAAGRLCDEFKADNELMAKVWESDDKLKEAIAEASKYRERLRIADTAAVGYQTERNEFIRKVNGLKMRLKKYEAVNE